MSARALERVAWFTLFLTAAGLGSVAATRPHTSAPVRALPQTSVLTDRQLRALIVARVKSDAARSGETLLVPPQVNTLTHIGPDRVVVNMTVVAKSWGSGRQVDFLLERGWHVTGWCVRGRPCETTG